MRRRTRRRVRNKHEPVTIWYCADGVTLVCWQTQSVSDCCVLLLLRCLADKCVQGSWLQNTTSAREAGEHMQPSSLRGT